MHASWCPLPWLSQNIRNNGDMRICDHSHHGLDNGLLRKSNGTVFNAEFDDIDVARNSEMLRSLRTSILSGEWHPACKRCMEEQKSGLPSRNQNEARLWSDYLTFDQAKILTEADGTVDVSTSPIRHYGVRFGNRCNQKCRSCGPTESDFWYQDYIDVWKTDKFRDGNQTIRLITNDRGKLVPDTDLYTWYEQDTFWKHVRSNAKNIRMIHMVGGEPMLIEKQYEFLSICIDLGIARDIIVEYNSNILKIPSKAWELWPHFKEVRIGASIDGIGAINDYIRHPSRWSSISDHLTRFDTDTTINFNVWIGSTVMIYNIWYLPDILEWFLLRKFQRIGWTPGSPLIFFHPLYRPSYLCARALPHDIKRKVAARFSASKGRLLDKVANLYAPDDHRFEALTRGIPEHLDKWAHWLLAEHVDGPMEKFWQYTDRLDALRSEDMSDVMPEWHEVLRGGNR